MKQPTTTLLLAALTLAALGCDPGTDDAGGQTPRGALLFELTDDDVEAIHAAYVPEEDVELLRARLTAPFDCGLYDDFCAQVGADAAEAITGEVVELALDGAAIEDIDAHLAVRIEEAKALADEDEAAGELTFRGSGPWTTDQTGDWRLQVRNGITTPVVGMRQGWTEARTQHRDWLGVWWAVDATQICVNTGTNTQTWTISSSSGTTITQLESINPANICDVSVSSLDSTTYHARNNGGEEGFTWWYTIVIHGSGTAQLNGNAFNASAGTYQQIF